MEKEDVGLPAVTMLVVALLLLLGGGGGGMVIIYYCLLFDYCIVLWQLDSIDSKHKSCCVVRGSIRSFEFWVFCGSRIVPLRHNHHVSSVILYVHSLSIPTTSNTMRNGWTHLVRERETVSKDKDEEDYNVTDLIRIRLSLKLKQKMYFHQGCAIERMKLVSRLGQSAD